MSWSIFTNPRWSCHIYLSKLVHLLAISHHSIWNLLVQLSLVSPAWVAVATHNQRVLNGSFEITKWNLKIQSYCNVFSLCTKFFQKIKVNIIKLKKFPSETLHYLFELFSRLRETYMRRRWSSKNHHTDMYIQAHNWRTPILLRGWLTLQEPATVKIRDLMTMIFK